MNYNFTGGNTQHIQEINRNQPIQSMVETEEHKFFDIADNHFKILNVLDGQICPFEYKIDVACIKYSKEECTKCTIFLEDYRDRISD